MTETQAKSGVTGASTDAADAPVDTKPAKDGSSPAGASSSSRPGTSSDMGTDQDSAGGAKGAAAPPAPASLPAPPPLPAPPSFPSLSPSARSDKVTEDESTVRAPIDGAGSKGSSVVPPSASHATGTASVSSTGHTPVVARATVASAPGTALRQATGSSPVVTPRSVGAARVSDAVRTARATVAGTSRGPRRARLHLKRIDPWSVMKFSFAVSLVLFVVAIVATSVLYLALDAMGVFSSLNQAMAEITGEAGGAADTLKITAKGVIGTSVLLGAVNMVLFTALMTLGAFVYNVCADLVGGIEVTLSEKE